MIKFEFPERFFWGTDCASFQVEGGAHENGKGPSIWGALCQNNPENFEGRKSPDDEADFFYYHKQDMKELGLISFRFSISWPRISPKYERDQYGWN